MGHADMMTVGLSGLRSNGTVALVRNGAVVACCERERITRVRRIGLPPGALPAETIDQVIQAASPAVRLGVDVFAAAEPDVWLPDAAHGMHVDHHEAHAAAAFYLSPFDEAAVLVCDSGVTHTSVWTASSRGLTAVAWPGNGPGLAALYRDAAVAFGWTGRDVHQLEALARTAARTDGGRFERDLTWRDRAIAVSKDWPAAVRRRLDAPSAQPARQRAEVAGAVQARLGELLLELAADVKATTGQSKLCLAGGLFYNTTFTTSVRQSRLFDDVFVPANPGNAGTAIGAALVAASAGGQTPARQASPFLGPEYDTEAIKRTLDNCKLSYECLDASDVVDLAAASLARGLMVGWFQGRMEWGHRALGNRSILAVPQSPYVLDNLNVYLKHRERHRSYGVSIPERRAADLFTGPTTSRTMEYEYRPNDAAMFAGVLPAGTTTLRVQTVPHAEPGTPAARFLDLHEQVGARTGLPVIVNTSFNGFAEPMVCSPRDAIRVFFGTGLDLLVIDRFVIRK